MSPQAILLIIEASKTLIEDLIKVYEDHQAQVAKAQANLTQVGQSPALVNPTQVGQSLPSANEISPSAVEVVTKALQNHSDSIPQGVAPSKPLAQKS